MPGVLGAVLVLGMPQSKRPITLGLLVDDLQSRYQMRLLEGVRRHARRSGARVTTFLGGWLNNSPGARFDSSFLFELATPLAVDGIISVSTILATEVGSSAVKSLCERSGLPLVSIGQLDGFVSVEANNALGMAQIAAHVVSVHQRTRIAFVQGPAGNADSQLREAAFAASLRELGVQLSPRLIVAGDFLEASGALAVSTLFDARAVTLDEVDCIVAANDLMAKGVLEELVARGVRVPEDVIVLGFDDDDIARVTEPPLTTVAQPIERIGATACELLLQILRHRAASQGECVATELVVRGSCGCGAAGSVSWAVQHPPRGRTLVEHAQTQRGVSARRLATFFGDDFASDGVDACLQVVLGSDAAAGRAALEHAMNAAAQQGLEPLRWHDVVRPFDDVIGGRSSEDPEVRAYRERIASLHLWISDAAASIQARDHVRTMQLANAVRVMGSALVCAAGIRGLAPILHAALPGLGVRTCFVCLFDEHAEGKSRARVVVRHTTDTVVHHPPLQRLQDLWRRLPGSVPPPSSSGGASRAPLLFPTVDLLPPELSAKGELSGLVIHPLVFAHDALGYVVFSEPELISNAWVLEAVAGHLSAAIYSIQNAERLKAAREVAERAYEAKSEFVAVMSHEIRTPMTGILGQVDLCLRGELAPQQRRGLELARTSGRTLLRIVNDLLDYSKIEAQRLELDRSRFRLDDVWLQVIGASGMAAADKGLELVLDVDLDVPDELVGDPLRLGQVLVNLTSNAVKFSGKGDITIRVRRQRWSRDTEVRLEFSVRDNGIGLTEDQMRSVFLPFIQGDSSTTRRYGGTGLGLTISQRLVRLMGGELHVESALGEGSVFSFEASFQECGGEPLGSVPRHPARILVVEDSVAQARAIERAFAGLGFLVESVSSLHEARLRLEAPGARSMVDLAIVDHQLLLDAPLNIAARLRSELGRYQGMVAVMAPHGSELAQIEQNLGGRAALVAKPLLRATLRKLASQIGELRSGLQLAADATRPAKPVVLVVLNDAELDVAVSEELRTKGLLVQTAKDGAAALNAAFRSRPGAVLISPSLSGMDGLAVTRVLRADERLARIPIVGLLRDAPPGLRERCLASGMNDLMAMDVDAERFHALVGTWAEAGGASARPTRMSHSSMLAITQTNAAELDVTQAMSRLGDDESLYRRLLRRFVDTHYTSAQAIRDAVLSDDWSAAERQAHSLASAAHIVGATKLHEAAHALEIVFRRGPSAGVNTLLAELDFASAVTLGAARSYLTNHSQPARAMRSEEELARCFARLRVLLREHDTSAVDQIEELRALVPQQARDSMRRLDARLRAYDFEGAREQLAELERSFAVGRPAGEST